MILEKLLKFSELLYGYNKKPLLVCIIGFREIVNFLSQNCKMFNKSLLLVINTSLRNDNFNYMT